MKYRLLLLAGLIVVGCTDRRKLYNEPASDIRSATLSFNPLNGTVISSFIDTRGHTMSTLYANAVAAEHARTVGDSAYPAGAVLTLVTWKQQPDPHWFGGNIPGEIATVEIVRYKDADQPISRRIYQRYDGHPLRQRPDTTNQSARIFLITHEKIAYTPSVENNIK